MLAKHKGKWGKKVSKEFASVLNCMRVTITIIYLFMYIVSMLQSLFQLAVPAYAAWKKKSAVVFA